MLHLNGLVKLLDIIIELEKEQDINIFPMSFTHSMALPTEVA